MSITDQSLFAQNPPCRSTIKKNLEAWFVFGHQQHNSFGLCIVRDDFEEVGATSARCFKTLLSSTQIFGNDSKLDTINELRKIALQTPTWAIPSMRKRNTSGSQKFVTSQNYAAARMQQCTVRDDITLHEHPLATIHSIVCIDASLLQLYWCVQDEVELSRFYCTIWLFRMAWK